MGTALTLVTTETTKLTVLATRIREAHQQVQKGASAALMTAMQAGDNLLLAQIHHRLIGPGGTDEAVRQESWLSWLESSCSINERTARTYMALANARAIIEREMERGVMLSVNAARRLIPKTESMAQRITDALKTAGKKGMTNNELARKFDVDQQKISACMWGLCDRGVAFDTGRKRKTSGNRPAPVYALRAEKEASSAPAEPQLSACAIDWENHREKDDEPDSVMRARAVDWQLHEALRLAKEFALLRPGTVKTEWKSKYLVRINKVFNAWADLRKLAQTNCERK